MITTENAIYAAEKKWLTPAADYIHNIFANTCLPSHDALHHLRVWSYSKRLLQELSRSNFSITPDTIESTLIASLFHDTGLTIDIGEKHGAYGVNICKQFLKEHPHLELNLLHETFDAIEKHDDKSLKEESQRFTEQQAIPPLSIVSTADDLDAFGYIGIFRYMEIYLKRGLVLEMLPPKVIANMNNRFANFRNTFFFLDSFVHQQKDRFTIALDFYTKLNEGYPRNWEIANFIALSLNQKHKNLTELTRFALSNHPKDSITFNFFSIVDDEQNAIYGESSFNNLYLNRQ